MGLLLAYRERSAKGLSEVTEGTSCFPTRREQIAESPMQARRLRG